ncbi:MAG: hypothetical protein IJJ23_03050 [Clostridia bacterium]|nr:hypothetical protein [Clostridia bacterium]
MQDNRILAKYKYVFLCVLLAGTPFGLGFGVIFGSARVGFAAGVLFGAGIALFLLAYMDFSKWRYARMEKNVVGDVLFRQDAMISAGHRKGDDVRFGAPRAARALFMRDRIVLITFTSFRNLKYDMFDKDRDSLLKDGGAVEYATPDETIRVFIIGDNMKKGRRRPGE